MAEELYAKPDLHRKVRFQTGEKEDRDADVCDNIDNVRIYDNYWAEGSMPPKSQDNTIKDQQQITSVNVSSGQRNLLRAVAVFLGLLCLLLLAAVIVLVVPMTQDESKCNMERNRLWVDYANLTSEREKLQRSYSKMESLNHQLTRTTLQLENKTDILEAINNNLTKERDELRTQIETTCCPYNWIKFGNSCYLVPTSEKTWSDSKTVCEDHDAQLVIISSIAEQRFISSFDQQTWIGLTDKENETIWKWVNGTEVTTTYWRSGQPDNNGPQKTPENCAQIVNNYNLNNWNDLSCNYLIHFICEKILQ